MPNRYGPWTKAILTRLGGVGRRLGYEVYTSKGNPEGHADVGEWLYDLTWIHYNRQRYIRSVPLVLESELGTDRSDQLDDFCKLMLARADHRAMVFGAANPKRAQATIDELVDEVEHSGLRHTGDRYLFAGLLESDGSFLCHLHVVE